jgi:hypothetical protein
MRRSLLAFALLAMGVVLGGCGLSAAEKRDIATAQRITKEFSESSGPDACRLLTNHAVVALYGKFEAPPAQSRALCKRAAARFRGEPVTFTRSELLDDHTIKINALDQDKQFSYQVNLRKGRLGHWRIDLISQARVTPE